MTHPGHDEHGPVIEGTTVQPHDTAPQGRKYDPFANGGAPGDAYGSPAGRAVQHDAVQPWTPTQGQGAYGPPPVLVMPAEKSVGVTILLTILFGVFGLFYATVPGALILLGITLGATLLACLLSGVLSVITLGVGAALFTFVLLIGIAAWITSIIWGLSGRLPSQRAPARAVRAGRIPPARALSAPPPRGPADP